MIKTFERPLNVETGPDTLLIVGDVHGQTKAYKKLLKEMKREAGSKTLITLGDVIDKGPDSLSCLRMTLGDKAADMAGAQNHVRLWGNHEILMVETFAALGTSEFELRAQAWRSSGMQKFLSGVTDLSGRASVAALIDAIGSDMLGNFQHWKGTHEIAQLRFAHAGYCPAVGWNISKTLRASDLWRKQGNELVKHLRHWASIRRDFLHHHLPQGHVVFHGHSAPIKASQGGLKTPGDVMRTFSKLPSHNRICLDGGAGRGKYVTGAVVRDGHYKLICVAC